MSDFEAGALVWKLRAVGKSAFTSDMRDAQSAFENAGDAAQKSAQSVDGQGIATERAGKKARELKAPLEDQASSQRKVGDESEKSSRKQKQQAEITDQQREAAKDLSNALLVAGAATGALVALSVAKYVEFDAQMSNTAAATKATADEQRILADAALDAGADSAYSATEAAAAQEELAKAGQSVSDIVGGSLTGSLALAAAGQLEVARSAEIMATVLTQFRLPAEQAGHVADVLAAGAGKAQGSVEDLALGLSYVGPLAASMGWSLEETAGTLAYFSTQGIAGEKAGTALRGVIAALQAPSSAAAKVMAEYGVNMYDANGRMLEAAPLAQELKDRLSGLTDQERQSALGRIFGNESLLAATLLYEGGAKAITTWTGNLNDAAYATEQAAQRQDNLAGDVEKLGGAFDTALIRNGSGANLVLREMVQILTEGVDIFGEAPAELQATALGLGAAATAAAILAGATLAVRARWSEWRETLDLTNGQMTRSAIIAGGVGIALTGVVTVVALLMQAQAEARQKAESYLSTLESGSNKVTQATREMASASLAARRAFLWMEYDSAYDAAGKLGISLDLVADAAVGDVDALKQLQVELDAARKMSLAHAGSAGEVEKAVARESGSIAEAVRVAEQKARADGEAVDAAREHENALADLSGIARDTNVDVQALADAISGFGAGELDAREAARRFEESLDSLRKTVEENGTSLDITTDAGRANEAALDAIAEAGLRSASAIATQTGSQELATQAVQRSRDELINVLGQFGITGQAAEDYADKLGLIPSNVPTAVSLSTDAAQQQLNAFVAAVESRQATLNVRVQTMISQGASDRELADAVGIGFADGGVVAAGRAVETYAAGGIREEHHIAQMAQAGAMRVWAEPETGGETYVPHAASKRSRSEAIMAETASIFGGMYIPAAALASGAASSPAGTTGGGVQVTIEAINIPPGVTYAEAVSIAKEAVREGVRDAIPNINF